MTEAPATGPRWNIADANAVNALISRLFGRNWDGADAPEILPDDHCLITAVTRLARMAHDTIGEGWTSGDAYRAILAMLNPEPDADDLSDAAREALAFERDATRGVLARLDGDVLLIDAEEWTADVVEEPPGSGKRLMLEHPSGIRRLVQVEVYGVGEIRPATPPPAGAPA